MIEEKAAGKRDQFRRLERRRAGGPEEGLERFRAGDGRAIGLPQMERDAGGAVEIRGNDPRLGIMAEEKRVFLEGHPAKLTAPRKRRKDAVGA